MSRGQDLPAAPRLDPTLTRPHPDTPSLFPHPNLYTIFTCTAPGGYRPTPVPSLSTDSVSRSTGRDSGTGRVPRRVSSVITGVFITKSCGKRPTDVLPPEEDTPRRAEYSRGQGRVKTNPPRCPRRGHLNLPPPLSPSSSNSEYVQRRLDGRRRDRTPSPPGVDRVEREQGKNTVHTNRHTVSGPSSSRGCGGSSDRLCPKSDAATEVEYGHQGRTRGRAGTQEGAGRDGWTGHLGLEVALSPTVDRSLVSDGGGGSCTDKCLWVRYPRRRTKLRTGHRRGRRCFVSTSGTGPAPRVNLWRKDGVAYTVRVSLDTLPFVFEPNHKGPSGSLLVTVTTSGTTPGASWGIDGMVLHHLSI